MVTDIKPVGASGATAVSCVADTGLTDVAGTPLNFTVEVRLKPIPAIDTVVPGAPASGLTAVIDSVGRNLCDVVADPSAVLTVIRPGTAPAAASTLSWLALATTTLAGRPSKSTCVLRMSPLPRTVTVLPVMPECGVKLMILGRTLNVHALVILL